MNYIRHDTKKYMLAAILGAIAGGLLVAFATKAIPKMMSKMMQNMIGQMQKSGCNPAEMCEKMMKGFGETKPEEAPSK